MPTNEKLLQGGICPACGWHIIVQENDNSSPSFYYWTCQRCGHAEEKEAGFTTLDDLAQQFADLKELEFKAFLHKIDLCAEARRRGQEVVNALCGYPGYTPQSVNRLGQLESLPDYLKDPQLSLGIIWEALKLASDGDDVDLDKFAQLIEETIVNQWSLGEFKNAHGIVASDRRQPVFDGVAELVQTDEHQWHNVEVKVYY